MHLLVAYRMTIEKRGKLTFCHTKDQNFDVNDYLLELKGQLKSWRDVYWRIWGMINHLTCTRCKEIFPCSDFGHCKYHPEPPRFDNETGVNSCIGTYPCCHLKTLRFDPTQQNKVLSVYTCICLRYDIHVIFFICHQALNFVSTRSTIYQYMQIKILTFLYSIFRDKCFLNCSIFYFYLYFDFNNSSM